MTVFATIDEAMYREIKERGTLLKRETIYKNLLPCTTHTYDIALYEYDEHIYSISTKDGNKVVYCNQLS